MLDTYLDNLYEDKTDAKSQATSNILKLFLTGDHFELLVNHDNCLNIISRVLREEYKRSVDITYNIVSIFYVLSAYTVFHQLVSQNQVGDSTIKIIEFNIKKYKLRKQEVDKRDAELRKNGTVPSEDVEKDRIAFIKMAKRTEKLLSMCFGLLLNLAEDLVIEKKMVKRKIVNLLIDNLDKHNYDLLYYCLSFLKKLSIFSENERSMVTLKIIEKLNRFLPNPDGQIVALTLRLIMNLSFDLEFCDQVAGDRFLFKIVELLKVPSYRAIGITILYQLSKSDKIRAALTLTECLPILYMLVIKFPEPTIAPELVALVVNLTNLKKNCEVFAMQNRFRAIFERAFKNSDTLLMKAVKNIVSKIRHKDVQSIINENLASLVKVAFNPNTHADYRIELFGIVAYSESREWEQVNRETNLVQFLQQYMQPGFCDDDITLECIMIVQNLAKDDKMSPILAKSMIIKQIIILINEKQEDDEVVNQLLFTVYCLLLNEATSKVILTQTQIVEYIMELLQDSNSQIVTSADEVLGLVSEISPEWHEEIKRRRFTIYNLQWLQAISKVQMSDELSYSPDQETDETQIRQWDDYAELANRQWKHEEIEQDVENEDYWWNQ